MQEFINSILATNNIYYQNLVESGGYKDDICGLMSQIFYDLKNDSKNFEFKLKKLYNILENVFLGQNLKLINSVSVCFVESLAFWCLRDENISNIVDNNIGIETMKRLARFKNL